MNNDRNRLRSGRLTPGGIFYLACLELQRSALPAQGRALAERLGKALGLAGENRTRLMARAAEKMSGRSRRPRTTPLASRIYSRVFLTHTRHHVAPRSPYLERLRRALKLSSRQAHELEERVLDELERASRRPGLTDLMAELPERSVQPGFALSLAG